MTSQKTYLSDMFDMSPMPTVASEDSEIAKFFTARRILITGGSGFMGKLLIEKLLRCCPNIETLYMFMRAKKGKSAQERFQEHFEDIVYVRLRHEQQNFAKKVVMIEGDTGESDLGLSAENRERLRDTEVIIHAAAVVRFDEKLRIAVNINVRGTKQLLLLAKELPNLKVFVYISTAFSQCVLRRIEEKFYKPPMETDKILTLVETLDDKTLESITPIVIDKWPNTYTYTKAIAEQTVRQYSSGIPTCIVRPSIVIATAKEPIPGWINNFYGPTGVVIGAAIGLLRSLHGKEENVADIIPADYVISNVIAATWDTAVNWNVAKDVEVKGKSVNEEETNEIPIYNSVSSVQKAITWGQFMKHNEMVGLDIPLSRVVWHYMFMLNRYLFMHRLCVIFLHLLPALLVDSAAYITGRKPKLLYMYKKIHKFTEVIAYFSMQEWRFNNDGVIKLWGKLNETDRTLFNFNLTNLDWDEYFYYHMRGVRVYLAKDPIDTVEIGKLRYKKLKVLHYTLMTAVLCLFFWGIIKFLFLWSLILYGQ